MRTATGGRGGDVIRRAVALVAVVAAVVAVIHRLVKDGSLTLDLGVGRRVRPLGPLVVSVDAPREVVFDVIAAPYLGRTPRALASKLRVLEHSDGLVLAEHFTLVGRRVTTTLETVRFERPERVHFRLVRGPVPHVVERFELSESGGATELRYVGELGTDLWGMGEAWGRLVAQKWTRAVTTSLEAIRLEAERRGARG